MHASTRFPVLLAQVLLQGWFALHLAAQSEPPLPAVSAPQVAAGFVSRDAAIDLQLDRPLDPGARLAVFIGEADVTDLFGPVPGGLRYDAQQLALPAGERDLTIYLVHANGDWRELSRIPLRVRGALGLDRARLDPRLDIGLEGQLAEGQEPVDPAPPRRTYQDLTGQMSLDAELSRGSLGWTNQAVVLGMSHREKALRFSQLADEAPLVDLSNYLVRLRSGESDLSLGHVALGRQRHLVNGFSSRGTRLGLRLGSRLDAAVGAVNGSSIVGWSNPTGLVNPNHRLVSGTVGLEALDRPGGLRAELSGIKGSVLPFAGYNQGVVNDAEESRGLAMRVSASDPAQRVRVEGGFARSEFENPNDPTLSQGETLVSVQRVTRNARYLDASVDVLRGLPLGGYRTAGVSLAYRHERVDPLYRSLGAYTQADILSNEWSAQATVAGVGIQAAHARSGDNLDDLSSILTSRTHRTSIGGSVPMSSILDRPTVWLPNLSYQLDRTRQFGEGLPDNGEFSESHVPDQVSLNQNLSADWQLSGVTIGYRLNRSRQDNRQTGRENADFTHLVNGFSLGLNPFSALSMDLSLDLERSENEQLAEVEHTRRTGARANWSPLARSMLAFSISHTRTTDDADIRERKDTLIDAQWSSFVPGLGRLGAQYYLRFSRAIGDATDHGFDLDLHTARWSIASGLNMSLS